MFIWHKKMMQILIRPKWRLFCWSLFGSVGDLPPLMLSPSQYHNYTQPRGNFIPYANEDRLQYRSATRNSILNIYKLLLHYNEDTDIVSLNPYQPLCAPGVNFLQMPVHRGFLTPCVYPLELVRRVYWKLPSTALWTNWPKLWIHMPTTPKPWQPATLTLCASIPSHRVCLCQILCPRHPLLPPQMTQMRILKMAFGTTLPLLPRLSEVRVYGLVYG